MPNRLRSLAEDSRFSRAGNVAVVLWLGLMTGAYVVLAVKLVDEPMNPGSDLMVVAIWLSVCALIVLTRAIWNTPLISWMWCITLVEVCFGMILLSEQVLSTLAFLWVGFAMASAGGLLLRLMKAETGDWL